MTVIVKQEFPYDVGIWRNLKAGMGGGWNVSQLCLFSRGSVDFSAFSGVLSSLRIRVCCTA